VFYELPYKQQFSKVYSDKHNVYNHVFSSKTAKDYQEKLDVAKAFARQFGDCYINPEINFKAKKGRSKIFKGIKGISNPDLTTVFGYVDVKMPKRYNNSVRIANTASKQEAKAVIGTLRMKVKPTEKQIEDIVSNVWKEKNYKSDTLFWYDHETQTIIKRNRPE
jgi:hypothetical protein